MYIQYSGVSTFYGKRTPNLF